MRLQDLLEKAQCVLNSSDFGDGDLKFKKSWKMKEGLRMVLMSVTRSSEDLIQRRQWKTGSLCLSRDGRRKRIY
ncbi:unnamed protein product [Blepharisma stoltei]|uniref:Uncharacterized protein n=1 Tax=Blepharisma stoltei TaxID=1481888 RepID=A0AAU9IC32_9CILI|nr:unnamed protein product [Blepharisma stoltei]